MTIATKVMAILLLVVIAGCQDENDRCYRAQRFCGELMETSAAYNNCITVRQCDWYIWAMKRRPGNEQD
jgi:hypothetical protein